MGTDARRLAQSRRASVVAPAGFGKTHLIAEAVTEHCDGRQLLLTHTHAGVRAMRHHLEEMGCPRSRAHVETISGWALRYSAAYPTLSEISNPQPTNSADWCKIYEGAVRLLDVAAIARVVQNSYQGLFVDEYQDCTASQHTLVLHLANLLPCRILGDPLQGIFDFEGAPIDWDTDVRRSFDALDELRIPYRWKGHNESLGRWLTRIRGQLEAGVPIEMTRMPPGVRWRQISPEAQRRACYEVANYPGTIAAIHEGAMEGPCQHLARRLGGRYQCMEPADCKELYEWARKIGTTSGGTRAALLIDFASSCLTKVKNELATIRRRLQDGAHRPGSRIRKHCDALQALERVARDSALAPVIPALDAIRSVPGAILFRRELWNAFRRTVIEFESGDHDTVADAAWKVRDMTRRVGRTAEKRTVSRTLLVKGLEFDHAIVLDADSLDKKQLYVALTRGTHTLTVLSKQATLQPH